MTNQLNYGRVRYEVRSLAGPDVESHYSIFRKCQTDQSHETCTFKEPSSFGVFWLPPAAMIYCSKVSKVTPTVLFKSQVFLHFWITWLAMTQSILEQLLYAMCLIQLQLIKLLIRLSSLYVTGIEQGESLLYMVL